ncbi:MAG: tRNA pseudouridine(38-40) synthase TruA [Bacteroidota bacterium]|nr:tRNA pseudouridine(38-40) synthase TruA [Bacteroidota bacterium]MEC9065457.1 tRNA pseudouridine(38-40) synthase TruA [Bacteroidota bacterium]MED5269601.1 tRNA pseudouridine(38-40) synthase TruA [Bacteroidota bacterium]|tara:strand:+ start:585 stop:1358 length:774 start_codon:yes stop_codon:yes gene_type:complete
MSNNRYFIEFSYDGSLYHGFQKQLNAITVQEIMENGISTILRDRIDIVSAGRTDTGVHAVNMFAHFDYDIKSKIEESNFCHLLNRLLPADIVVIAIHKVKSDSHSRFDAISRTYNYYITDTKNPFNHKYRYYLSEELDYIMMNKASKILYEHQDFKCFSKSNTDVKTYNCKITNAEWVKSEDDWKFIITSNRFLRNMVRAIVGTLIEIGRGKLEIDDLDKIIQSKDRRNAGYSVPAEGLFLKEIIYDKKIFIESWKK